MLKHLQSGPAVDRAAGHARPRSLCGKTRPPPISAARPLSGPRIAQPDEGKFLLAGEKTQNATWAEFLVLACRPVAKTPKCPAGSKSRPDMVYACGTHVSVARADDVIE